MKSTIIAAALALSLSVLGGGAANATPLQSKSAISKTEGVATLVQYGYGRCAFWYRECRIRWGYGWRFRRCLAIRNCI